MWCWCWCVVSDISHFLLQKRSSHGLSETVKFLIIASYVSKPTPRVATWTPTWGSSATASHRRFVVHGRNATRATSRNNIWFDTWRQFASSTMTMGQQPETSNASWTVCFVHPLYFVLSLCQQRGWTPQGGRDYYWILRCKTVVKNVFKWMLVCIC